MDKLIDIKGFVDVPDVSLYLFLAILIFAFLLLIFAGLKAYKYFKTKGKNPKDIAKKKLSNLDFKDAKKAAYAISKYGLDLAQNDNQKEFLDELSRDLAKYKYQKNVPEFADEDKKRLKTFMELCDA